LGTTVLGMDKLHKVPDASAPDTDADKPVPPTPARPTLTRIK
jgi:hypothetical protein